MKTKAEIVQRLLEEKSIDAEEAVVLLLQEKETQFIPYTIPPQYPVSPYTPCTPMPLSPIYNPWPTMSHTGANYLK